MTTYKKAGVDVLKGDRFVEMIKPLAASCPKTGVIDGIGGFAGMFSVPGKFKDPVFAVSTDGVGTKLRLAFAMGKHDTVGIDLVAMVANDILCIGAGTLWFLDYFATGRLDLKTASKVMSGIAEGCRTAGCALIGGETAEMPGMYAPGEYDLAGFGVGVVERRKIVDGRKVMEGDVIVGIESSGIHSNGYSLVRRILKQKRIPLGRFERCLDDTVGNALLAPTLIYVKPVLKVLGKFHVRALAHVTGGGLPGNLARQFPRGLAARIWRGAWDVPPVFDFIAGEGKVAEQEMFNTFNMGVGFAVVVPRSEAVDARKSLARDGLESWRIGEVVKRKKSGDDFILDKGGPIGREA